MTDLTGGQDRRTATVTVLFCDLVGSTDRQSRSGDDANDDFRRRFFAALRDAVVAGGGETIKNTGDGLMVVFRDSAVDAVACATRMHTNVEALDPADPASVRVGISAGEAASEDGDWFGTPVVEAARLCAVADAGQTLVSQLVRGLVGSRGGHHFRAEGGRRLKGLIEPVAVFSVERVATTSTASAHAASPPVRIEHGGRRRAGALAGAAIIAALAVTLAVLANRGGSQSAGQSIPAANYPVTLTHTRCAADFLQQVPKGTCSTLGVPEDRTGGNRRRLQLLVTRSPDRSDAAAAEPTIAIDPSGVSEDPARSPALAHGDLVKIATRWSITPDRAMGCPELTPVKAKLLAGSPRDPTTIAEGRLALQSCYERLIGSGRALQRYTADDAADDVVDLIRALGGRPVNLVAGQDAGRVALAVLRHAPGAVRTLTLENPTAPGVSASTDPVATLAYALDRYVARCDDNVRCATSYPGLARHVAENYRYLQAAPTTFTVDVSGQTVDIRLDGDRSIKAIAMALELPNSLPLLAAGIATVPGEVAAQFAAIFDFDLVLPEFPIATELSARCSYEPTTRLGGGASVSAAARPELSGVDDGTLDWMCDAWPVPKAKPAEFTPASSDVPTLIVVGDLTPFSSPEWASTLQAGLTHSTLVRFPTLGGSILARGLPTCLGELRRQLLATPTRRLDADPCAKQSPPIEFVTSAS